MMEFLAGLDIVARVALLCTLGAMGGLIVFAVTFAVARFLGRRWPNKFELLDELYLWRLRMPAGAVFGLTGVIVSSIWWIDRLDEPAATIAAQLFHVAVVLSVAWFLVRLVDVIHALVGATFDITAADNLEARKVLTQTAIARRLFVIFLWIVALAAILLRFQSLREVGAGLLASAGIVGVVFGIAAQRTLGTIFAGLHIAITQPIRVDDVVVIEGEWGKVEEITLTYIVVRIWDKRRLIVPVDYVLKQPLQNWTRTAADVMGTVFLRLDYLVPIDDVRGALEAIVEETPLWDGEVCVLHVTDVSDKAVELRALVSAADSGTLWDLRCHVREELVEWVAEHHPDALPIVRIAGAEGTDPPALTA